jgi:hypothetical protein
LLDSANLKYQNLAAKNEIKILKLQLDAINSGKEEQTVVLLLLLLLPVTLRKILFYFIL